ncbi:MAG TPA: alpha/beta hydrolase [Intrasporangium sp.]|uniref:alpha/beta hydrolase n=1 Tax=Intrasporangium sp. TaxID=1925024 RepID=UPI002D790C3F|nr:alpha/beta hydrolase [Intrasporangium sp.]HET7398359.1 alpha/beta hydrolase [Intrasporangium sp.]
MPRSSMPLRTRLLVALMRRERRAISALAPEEIETVRHWVAAARAPYTWVTGPLYSDVEVGETSFAARDGASVPVRVYRPGLPGASASVPRPSHLPCVVFFHGGGWVLGQPRAYDPLCTYLAHEAGVVVVSVDYRLAPEHRAPQAVLDAVDAVRWVTEEADRLGVVADGLGVAGDSAGGNLAAVASRVLRDEGGARVGHQALLYPGTDATMSSESVREHAHAPVLTRADMEAFLAHYRGDGPDALALTDPLLSPLHALDLSGLPPALVQTADLDPLRDEGLAYAARLREAGVPVQVTNYPGAPHGFASFPGATRVGRASRRELAEWVARHAGSGVVD